MAIDQIFTISMCIIYAPVQACWLHRLICMCMYDPEEGHKAVLKATTKICQANTNRHMTNMKEQNKPQRGPKAHCLIQCCPPLLKVLKVKKMSGI